MLALGRMVRRPGYKIISTAQTGDIARRMWREVVQMLDQQYAGMEDEDRPYKARVANGTEELRWSNGSTWRPVTPSPLSYRSQAADLLIFEEAGHIAPELAADLQPGDPRSVGVSVVRFLALGARGRSLPADGLKPAGWTWGPLHCPDPSARRTDTRERPRQVEPGAPLCVLRISGAWRGAPRSSPP